MLKTLTSKHNSTTNRQNHQRSMQARIQLPMFPPQHQLEEHHTSLHPYSLLIRVKQAQLRPTTVNLLS